uniref:DUF5641 domain-containing protein n=1 Tax=Phlebotomus papatasi TaxID=29031 RepID=A0A1B0DAL3_PHLPP
WKKLVRVVAYLRRFTSNCFGPPEQRTTGPLKSNEIFDATRQILHLVQAEVFPLETRLLKAGKSLPHSSNLLSLNVFYDEGGLIRVGGRLDHSNLPSEAKHQILLPSKHHVTNLIIDEAHKQTMHGGTLTTSNHLRSRYWIIRGKWTLVTKLNQDFWKRWATEYLHLLQTRSKWKRANDNICIGELVLIIEDNLPPRKWQLGRIMETHPGEDGMVRIVSVKSNGHVKKRYLRKLARLPLSDPESEDNEAALQHGLVSTEDADFWKRWATEYLHLLQTRSEWKRANDNICIGELVLIIEDNLPPRKWQLGRIMETHPGEDGMVRIVSVKSNGHVKNRYLRKLARLPLSDPESEDNEAALQHGLVSTEEAVSLQDTTDDSMVPGPSKSKTEESTNLSDGRYDMKSETSSKQRKSARLSSPERKIENDPVLLSAHLTVPMSSESHRRIAMASSTTKPDKPTKRKIEDSPKQTEKKRSKKTRIRPCTWFHSTLQVCLYMLCLLTLVFGKKYEIIQPQTGFVIENHGIAYIKCGELQLETNLKYSSMLHTLLEPQHRNGSIIQIRIMSYHLECLKQFILKSYPTVPRYTSTIFGCTCP